eukprot:793255-Rhodomonas_salina.2
MQLPTPTALQRRAAGLPTRPGACPVIHASAAPTFGRVRRSETGTRASLYCCGLLYLITTALSLPALPSRGSFPNVRPPESSFEPPPKPFNLQTPVICRTWRLPRLSSLSPLSWNSRPLTLLTLAPRLSTHRPCQEPLDSGLQNACFSTSHHCSPPLRPRSSAFSSTSTRSPSRIPQR